MSRFLLLVLVAVIVWLVAGCDEGMAKYTERCNSRGGVYAHPDTRNEINRMNATDRWYCYRPDTIQLK